MKTKLLFLALLSLTMNAQTSETDEMGQSSLIGLTISPGSWDDGFSFGVQYEHHNKNIYYGPDFYFFPNLNGMDYFHAMGRIGINKEWGNNHVFRIQSGARLAVIYRETGGFNYASVGLELGVQWILPNGIFGKIAGTFDNSTESKLWSNNDNFTRESVYVTFGIRL